MITSTEVSRSEKRKYARLDIALSVSYAVRDSRSEISELAEALSSDISATGIRLMTPKPVRPGSLIDLEISIDGKETKPIYAKGEVVWQNRISKNSFETGAVIKHMEEIDKQRFMGFVFDQMSRVVGGAQATTH